MATWEDVRRIALRLPDTAEGTTFHNTSINVHGKSFVWQRPLNKSDLKKLGEAAPPEGPILAAYVETLDDKDALVTEEPDVFFTIEHFTGFRAVLILLDRIEIDRLEDIITEAWLVRAPKRVAAAFLAEHPPAGHS
jgi:hypothetical protein